MNVALLLFFVFVVEKLINHGKHGALEGRKRISTIVY